MQSQSIPHVDILKIDIEDAEGRIFSIDSHGWIKHIRTIAIEIHSPKSLEAVITATQQSNFSHQVYRSLHFFYR
jgi:hypothetical protein